MKIARTIEEVRDSVNWCKREGRSIGLVPTMGFLHQGHGSLIKKAREENDFVMVSDFVNPAQFGPNEDLESYPRDFEADCELCKGLGVDLIFYPAPSEMYQNPHTVVDISLLSNELCGSKRPGHFRGVCTVVSKLFNISKADRAYFGQKDAQQLVIIKKMVKDLNFDVEVIGCPIVREKDGLAMSSRNTYLNDTEREAALCLSKAISAGKNAVKPEMKSAELQKIMTDIINSEPLSKIDYVSVVDSEELQPLEKIDKSVLVAVAVYIGKTRLIDNFFYEF